MTAAIRRAADRQREHRVQHVRRSSADTELHSSNTQGPNQILLFEIHQALDCFALKLSFIIATESDHLGRFFSSPLAPSPQLMWRTNGSSSSI